MHYVFDLTILPTNLVDNPALCSIKLGAGIIKHATIVFPAGVRRKIRCYVAMASKQIMPTNQDSYYSEDNYVVEAPFYIKMSEESNELWFVAWSVGSGYNHNLRLMLEVQGVDEPSPEESIRVLGSAIEALVTKLRSWL